MKSFKKNVKAVSPVLSVLMMIAVAVAASLVTYAWVMGYLSFTTAKVGKAVQIQSIAKSGSDLKVYVQNVGSGSVTMADIYVGGIRQTTVVFSPSATINEGQTVTCTINSFGGSGSITVRAVTLDGTFTEATATVGP
jgi:flagellin-like protein